MKRSWWLAAAALAILVLLVSLGVSGRRSRQAPDLSELAAALGNQRFIEPRLTGGFGYATCRTEKSPNRLLPEVTCSDPSSRRDSREVIRRYLAGLDDSNFHARGVALLLGADSLKMVNAAVEGLEKAAAREARNVRVLSDLAAAYFVRAHWTDEPEDLIRSLDAAQKAYEIAPSLAEARFNRALVLDRLRLRNSAVEAWEDDLEADPRSEWIEEVRGRIEALSQPASESPQVARETAFEILGDWGRAVLSQKRDAAERHLYVAAEIGRHNPAVEETVAAIQKAARTPDLIQLANGHVALQEGFTLFGKLEAKKAKEPFQQAQEALHQAGSPAEFWALCGLARCLAYAAEYEKAEGLFQQVWAEASRKGVPSLAGWAQWGIAWSRIRQGRLSEGLSHYRLAEREYVKAGEAENLAAVRNFLGENLYLLGQEAAGWRYRYQALVALSGMPSSFRRHVLLLEGASAAVNQGFLRAGLLLQEEDVRIAEETRNPVIQTEAHGARSRILFALDRAGQARRDLEASQRSARLAPDSPPGQKLVADLLWITGESIRRKDPSAAIVPLTRAIDIYRRLEFPLSVVQALLSRYRIYEGLGSRRDAEADLTSALSLIEESGRSIRDQDLKSSYAEAVQSAYDDMIRLQWQRGDREKALSLLERARAFPGPLQDVPVPGKDRIGKDRVIVSYALLPDRLLGWVLDGEHVSTFERRIGREDVNSQVARMVAAIQNGGPEIRKISGTLHDLLIPPAVLDLTDDRTLYFVPDRALSRVPFAALWNERRSRFLIEDHPIAIAPTLSSLRMETPARRGRTEGRPSVLLVGNPAIDRSIFHSLPELKHAGEEMEAVRSAFPDSLVLSGPGATRQSVLAELDRADLFIFIGHSVANASDPSRSYQVLAPSSDPPDSGLLLNRDLGEARFQNLRLVVLSACSTVGPGASRTSGLAGLAGAFLKRGAETVIGTLVPLEDRSALNTLDRFYRGLAEGHPAVMALRAAQLESIEQARAAGLVTAGWSVFEAVAN